MDKAVIALDLLFMFIKLSLITAGLLSLLELSKILIGGIMLAIEKIRGV